MKILCNKIFLEHKTESHPECPERLLAFGNMPESAIENGGKPRFKEEKTKSAANVQEEFRSRIENLKLNIGGHWNF